MIPTNPTDAPPYRPGAELPLHGIGGDTYPPRMRKVANIAGGLWIGALPFFFSVWMGWL